MRKRRFVLAMAWSAAAGLLGCGHTVTPEEKKLQAEYSGVLVMYYQAFKNNGQPPVGLGDMDPVIPGLQEGYDAVKAGRLVVVWNTPISKDDAVNAAVVLAFERDAYAKGGLVQMVDPATSKQMTAEELKAALKKNPAWDPALIEQAPKNAERPPAADGDRKPLPQTTTDSKERAAASPDEPVADRDLLFLGRLYLKFCQEHARPPADDFEFRATAQRPEEQTAARGILNGAYVVILGVDVPNAKDMDAILAYEKDAPEKGGWVVTAGGDVKRLTAEQFKAAPKAKGEAKP